MELAKGANAPLVGTVFDVEVRWDAYPSAAVGDAAAGGAALDVSALRLGVDGKVRQDADFVFFNAPATPDGALRHLGTAQDSETIRVDVGAQPATVAAVVVMATIDVATPELTFAGLPVRAVVRDVATGATAVSFVPPALTNERALVVVEVYRRGSGWKVRAVGQGYASGLAGLATDYGVDIADTDSASTAPMGSTAASPAAAPIGSTVASPAAAGLPIDMRKRLDLRKRAVGVVMEKAGIPHQRARVGVVLDASGSMFATFRCGAVARAVERLAAVAARLDDDGSLDAWAYATKPLALPPLAVESMATWIPLYVRTKSIGTGAGGAKETKAREAAARQAGVPVPNWSAIGGTNDEPAVMRSVADHYRRLPSPPPALVIFLSDGGVHKNAEIEAILRETSTLPLFWQFVGVGGKSYGVLRKLDVLGGRLVDNAGFFAIDDLDMVSDDELYARLLGEFPTWLRNARAARLPV